MLFQFPFGDWSKAASVSPYAFIHFLAIRSHAYSRARFEMVKNIYSPAITSDYNYPAAFMDQEEITRIAEIETDLKNYAEQTKAGIVKDGITDEDWNAYLEKMDSMGLSELLELKQKGFDMFYELTNKQ